MSYKKIKLILIEFIVVYIVLAILTKHQILISLIFIIVPAVTISIIFLNSKERSLVDLKKHERLSNFCFEKISDLNKLMEILYTLNKNYRLSKVEHFVTRLKNCSSLEEYHTLLNLITHEIMYISAVIEVWSRDFSQSNQRYSNTEDLNQKKLSIRDKKINAALIILELSPKTLDFTVIKKQYRTLMMKYHPDKNHSEEAKEIAISINAAYEILEHEFAI